MESKALNILLVEPFFSGSHQKWAEALKKYSAHNIEILSLPGKHWKWRMHGGAVELAGQFMLSSFKPDLILASDMLDLNVFLSLSRQKSAHIPATIYFHENQLTYPWSPEDEDVKKKRDLHYSFINYTSALAANKLLFNSEYHRQSFLHALPGFLNIYPDFNGTSNIKSLTEKSEVLHLGIDLQKLHALKPENQTPSNRAVILWNHRWEYDKNPQQFFEALIEIKNRGVEFKLIVLGEKTEKYPAIFDRAREELDAFIIHWGYAENIETYARLLWSADILPVTSSQDFFGGSVVEAMACDVFPLLPNRLVYPEHLPAAYSRTFLYEEHENFVNRLQRLIFDVKVIRKQNIHQWVMHYDWHQCIGQYDKVLRNIASGKK
jgi:glycosyltransferase involved in cell wall biosynthesis